MVKWFKRSKSKPNVTPEEQRRYAGKPFLGLLDGYVLKTIGHLDPKKDAGLKALEGKFQEIFKSQSDWCGIVKEQLGLADSLDQEIQELWERYSSHVKNTGAEPDPVAFTHQFVAQNFPDI